MTANQSCTGLDMGLRNVEYPYHVRMEPNFEVHEFTLGSFKKLHGLYDRAGQFALDYFYFINHGARTSVLAI